jgi:hypothetical protein
MMSKSEKSPLWLRLLPGILLISIPIVWWIYGFMEANDPDSRHFFFIIGLLIIVIFIIISTTIVLFPFAGGILSLLLLLIILVPYFPDNFSDVDIFSIYISSMLFLAGIIGLCVGVWNFRYRRHSNSNVNPQNGSYNKT